MSVFQKNLKKFSMLAEVSFSSVMLTGGAILDWGFKER